MCKMLGLVVSFVYVLYVAGQDADFHFDDGKSGLDSAYVYDPNNPLCESLSCYPPLLCAVRNPFKNMDSTTAACLPRAALLNEGELKVITEEPALDIEDNVPGQENHMPKRVRLRTCRGKDSCLRQQRRRCPDRNCKKKKLTIEAAQIETNEISPQNNSDGSGARSVPTPTVCHGGEPAADRLCAWGRVLITHSHKQKDSGANIGVRGSSSCLVETQTTFKHLDVNEDGFLYQPELARLVRAFNEPCISKFIARCMRRHLKKRPSYMFANKQARHTNNPSNHQTSDEVGENFDEESLKREWAENKENKFYRKRSGSQRKFEGLALEHWSLCMRDAQPPCARFGTCEEVTVGAPDDDEDNSSGSGDGMD